MARDNAFTDLVNTLSQPFSNCWTGCICRWLPNSLQCLSSLYLISVVEKELTKMYGTLAHIHHTQCVCVCVCVCVRERERERDGEMEGSKGVQVVEKMVVAAVGMGIMKGKVTIPIISLQFPQKPRDWRNEYLGLKIQTWSAYTTLTWMSQREVCFAYYDVHYTCTYTLCMCMCSLKCMTFKSIYHGRIVHWICIRCTDVRTDTNTHFLLQWK